MEFYIRDKERDGSRYFLEYSVDCGAACGQLHLPSMVGWLYHELWLYSEISPFPWNPLWAAECELEANQRKGRVFPLPFSVRTLWAGEMSL